MSGSEIKLIGCELIALKKRESFDIERTLDFVMRPEQKDAVTVTKNYFKTFKSLENKPPHFLWNCKMRFGKTFASYKLANKMHNFPLILSRFSNFYGPGQPLHRLVPKVLFSIKKGIKFPLHGNG